MTNPKRTTSIAGHPIHPMLIPFPIAFFVSAFVCDLAYWQTSNNKQRVGHSGTLAHWCGPRDGRTRRGGGPYRCLGRSMMPGGTREETSLSCLLKTQFLCSLLEGSSAVLPNGLVLSLVVVCILLFTGWKSWEMVYRYRVGVADVENREATPATTRRAA